MDINTANTVRDLINATSLAVLIVVFGIALIGVFRPKALAFVLREFARRRYILVGGVFTGLLCGTIYTATQPDYGSFDASQPKPTAQSQSPLPQTQNQETADAQTQGISTDQTEPVEAPTGTQRSQAPQQPSQIQVDQQGSGNTKNDARQVANHSKSDKDCNGTQVLFVCF